MENKELFKIEPIFFMNTRLTSINKIQLLKLNHLSNQGDMVDKILELVQSSVVKSKYFGKNNDAKILRS